MPPVETRILPFSEKTIAEAAQLILAGEAIAVPTETVYGLAADATNPQAVARIYDAKGRPAFNPLIVHASGTAMARACVAEWPEAAGTLAAEFWPGPPLLTKVTSPGCSSSNHFLSASR